MYKQLFHKMEKTIQNQSGPKVSQIANLFQRKPVELTSEVIKENQSPATTVVRTESHAARFNNARALFEKLGEGRVTTSAALSITMSHSNSRDELSKDLSPDRENGRSPSPKRKHAPFANNNIINGVTKIHNISRIKMEKPEKPEKPERKFNSKELIEKQKNWTSHFSKTRSSKFNGDQMRCDIIRTVPGTGIIPGANQPVSRNSSFDGTSPQSPTRAPPSPPKRHTPPPPPDTKPRSSSKLNYNNNTNSNNNNINNINNYDNNNINHISPTKYPAIPNNKPDVTFVNSTNNNNINNIHNINNNNSNNNIKIINDKSKHMIETIITTKSDELPEKIRKRSLDLIEEPQQLQQHSARNGKYIPENESVVRKNSVERDNSEVISPARAISSSPSPSPGVSASSEPSSPIYTEDEKQENESTEKADYFDEIMEIEGECTPSIIIFNPIFRVFRELPLLMYAK